MMTGMGVILGTAAYMSPEQARGATADRRADLWAFGVVLWEMLTAKRPFEGATVSDTLASVLKTEPDWNALAPTTPAAIRRLLRRCLEKDRKRRFDSAAAARLEIEEAMTAPSASDGAAAPPEPAPRSAWSRALPWAVATVLGVVALLVWAPWRSAAPPHVTRATITTSGPSALTITGINRDLALSPDGTHVVYVGNKRHAALRPRARCARTGRDRQRQRGTRAIRLAGWPVGRLRRQHTRSRRSRSRAARRSRLPAATAFPEARRGRRDDTIIFATSDPATGLQRVSAAGGTPEVLTRPDRAQGEADHLWPELLPGGRAVLFTITSQTGGLDTAQVAVHDLRTGTHDGTAARREPRAIRGQRAPGLRRGGRAARDRLRSEPARDARHGGTGRCRGSSRRASALAISPWPTDGTLVYADAQGSLATDARTLVWVDRAGKEEPVAAPPRAYLQPRLSPDGTRVAL